MNRKRNLILILTLLLFTFSFILAEEKSSKDFSKPVIAVKTFENPPNYYNSTVGNGLTDLFITELQKTGKYRIIERAAVKDLMDEVDFGKSGYVEQNTAVKKGHIMGVEYYFFAKVTNFGQKKKKIGGGGWGGRIFGGLGYKKKEAYVRIDFRIVDATSGETVYAGYGEGKCKRGGLSFGGGRWGSGGGALDVSSDEFLASMVGRATMAAIHDIINKMDHDFLARHKSRAKELKEREEKARLEALEKLRHVPGKVLAVTGDSLIVVSLGANNGIRVGDRLQILKQNVIKDSHGNVVYSEDVPIGVLVVYKVQPDRSLARKESGNEIKEGFKVKVID